MRLRTMLHVEGGEIVRFYVVWRRGAYRGGERDRFSCGEGREKRVGQRANHISRRGIGAYQDEDSIRLIGR